MKLQPNRKIPAGLFENGWFERAVSVSKSPELVVIALFYSKLRRKKELNQQKVRECYKYVTVLFNND